ncbi:DUF6263 family protein [Mucilaginibacter phyllosphaerae]|uniref:Uncharacterized protein (DUF1778 family) n=1 Tax=Mucilaginibacter phyllosphaerae TaxID=1812349 RepID=A0A4Y8AGB5_9SPHI|nr:DUF6263 family protein [Mucilaginibacter phyllosphaerae]MBB3968577.1 uncharacterized protein (DUF1778 family) [Mucilaginibacter phyllosphaerae]TEW67783.1 hypothetical protein E2R65_07280 [Mucilaginibacter phyllosphaerae]GGH15140.1 hypothetical protein GCM10007352_23720 [Mucilaginibacter phyllosphaerae]
MKLTFTLLILLIAATGYSQKIKLQLNLQKDSTYTITMNAKMDIDQLIQGAHQIVKTTITGVMSHKVISIQDTLYDMDVTYKSLVMNMELGGKTINFNSQDNDTTNIMSKAMRNMIGNSFTIMMSKRGQIVTVKNTERLFAGIFKGFPAIDEQKKTQLMAQLQQSFGDKSIKGNLQESFVIFPKVQVDVKSNWTNQTFLEAAAISAKTKTTFTLDGVTDDAYEISGTAVIMADKVPEFKNSNKFFIRLLNIAGDNVTKVKINKKTGWIMQSNVKKHIKGDVELKQTLDGPILITYPMVIDGDLSTTGN